ncbi:ABC transporter ATP-binding protein [Lewinellaceae bacterium SD302]|nr:ABC transporter ATP-binding protein [Lewinellaceae bacterium SD302]
MSNLAIKIESLGKRYQRGSASNDDGSFRHWLSKLFRTRPGKKDTFWALKELQLDVPAGEILGMVGRNGSGKSTLLKILSGITPPTTGRAILNGRVASLLEVGTGFHHELSGRENIYLNGAILGMRRAEINACFDEIVDFSGVGEFIDTKVKHYSSGMYVRLAFSVAAHLRTDILLIDEVLAVGDAEFQKRSLGKMNEVVRDSGRTIVFVSHDLPVIRQLCTTAIGLDSGKLFTSGSPEKVIGNYHDSLLLPGSSKIQWRGQLANKVAALTVNINGQALSDVPAIPASQTLKIECRITHEVNLAGKLHIAVYRQGTRLFTIQDRKIFSPLVSGDISLFKIAAHRLRPGNYQLAFGGITEFDQGRWFYAEDVGSFTVTADWKDDNDRINFGWINAS